MSEEPEERVPWHPAVDTKAAVDAAVAATAYDPVEPGPDAPRPAGAKPSVARYLGQVTELEIHLREALILVAERHERNFEIAQGATTLATWSSEHLAWLAPVSERYGHSSDPRPALLRSALLGGTRIGVTGEIADVTDLGVLIQKVQLTWLILRQGARELHDPELLDIASRAHDHARRQLAWVTTMVEHEAPDAIAIVPDRRGQLLASIPKRPTSIASIPDPIWGSITAGVQILVVGLLGLLAGSPWLVPSLGPTAVLVALMPAHPTARAWNTFGGHLGGLLAGFIAVAIVGAAGAPTVMGDHVLVPVRVAAATIAIVLTIVFGSLLRASHPPAAATTLLVALGGIGTAEQALALMAGVLTVTVLGEALRVVRIHRLAPAERLAPRDSFVARLLHRS
jgi:hypothetical protein